MTEPNSTCADYRDLISLLVSGDVSPTELADVREHLGSCTACRAEFELLREDDRRLNALADSHAERIAALRWRTTAALPDRTNRPTRQGWLERNWRWIMSTTPRRTAALAAVAAVIVFFTVFFQGPGGSFDAWAQVIEAIGNVTSGQFKIRPMDDDGVEAVQVFAAHGTSHETYQNDRLVESMYVDFARRELVYISPEARCAMRATFDAELQREYTEHHPDQMFAFMQEYEYEDIGRRRIDGKSVVGIRVQDARFLAERLENAEIELWVDPETKLPVRLDVKGDVTDHSGHGQTQKHIRFEDFRWNVPAGDDEFRPEIPRSYDVVGPVHLQQDEEHFIDGLRLYAETVGDSYPSSLSYESVKVDLWSRIDVDRDGFLRMLPKLFQVRMASEFYGELVDQGQEVVYFGHSVRPSDTDRVLIRWKASDDRYRVIFGDLRAETVSGEELLQLEGR